MKTNAVVLDVPSVVRKVTIVVQLRRLRWARLRLAVAMPFLWMASLIGGLSFPEVEYEEVGDE